MSQLVCETCGEVLMEDLTEADADEAQSRLNAEDHTHDDGEEEQESDDQSDGLDDRTDVEEMEDELEDDFEDKVEEVTDQEHVEDTTDDVEEYADAAQSENVSLDVLVGSDTSVPGARWQQCEQDAEPVSDIFKDKLRQMRRAKTQRGQRSGSFDSGRMIQATRGDPRVFEREEEGDEAEYETYIVLDRSYSMKNTEMAPAENAVATLMLALEEAGVSTELVDFYNDDARVINTKTQDAEAESGNILQGSHHADGGTPLGKIMQLVADRIEGVDGQPFVIVVTDGRPGSLATYEDAVDDLAEEDVPVLGVTVGQGTSIDEATMDQMYDSHVTVTNNTKLKTKLEELARGVMF